MIYIKDESPRFTTFPNTEKKVENTTGSGTFLTNFDVFGHVVWQIRENKGLNSISVKINTT